MLLRTHRHGSKEMWLAQMLKRVQSWKQDRDAQKVLGEPRSLVAGLNEFETDVLDFETAGGVVDPPTKLLIFKGGLAPRIHDPVMAMTKEDLRKDGTEYDYEGFVELCLQFYNNNQPEILAAREALKLKWRGRRPRRAAPYAVSAKAATANDTLLNKRCWQCGRYGHLAAACKSNSNKLSGGAKGGSAHGKGARRGRGRAPR